jgi:hypothetical protein
MIDATNVIPRSRAITSALYFHPRIASDAEFEPFKVGALGAA